MLLRLHPPTSLSFHALPLTSHSHLAKLPHDFLPLHRLSGAYACVATIDICCWWFGAESRRDWNHVSTLHAQCLIRPQKALGTYTNKAGASSVPAVFHRNVVVSIAKVCAAKESSRIDIVSLNKRQATERPHVHLNKLCFAGEGDDRDNNLPSWSSSLLFVIQHAIWRCRQQNGRSPDGVKIYVVDTTKFPRAQIARSRMCLCLE